MGKPRALSSTYMLECCWWWWCFGLGTILLVVGGVAVKKALVEAERASVEIRQRRTRNSGGRNAGLLPSAAAGIILLGKTGRSPVPVK